jgi:hypothetical protein
MRPPSLRDWRALPMTLTGCRRISRLPDRCLWKGIFSAFKSCFTRTSEMPRIAAACVVVTQ